MTPSSAAARPRRCRRLRMPLRTCRPSSLPTKSAVFPHHSAFAGGPPQVMNRRISDSRMPLDPSGSRLPGHRNLSTSARGNLRSAPNPHPGRSIYVACHGYDLVKKLRGLSAKTKSNVARCPSRSTCSLHPLAGGVVFQISWVTGTPHARHDQRLPVRRRRILERSAAPKNKSRTAFCDLSK